jgi:hypothetical protein
MRERIKGLVEKSREYKAKRKPVHRIKKSKKKVIKKSNKEIRELREEIKKLKAYIRKLEKTQKPSKKAPVKKAPVKKVPVKKVPVKKAPVKKASAKKAPVKKVYRKVVKIKKLGKLAKKRIERIRRAVKREKIKEAKKPVKKPKKVKRVRVKKPKPEKFKPEVEEFNFSQTKHIIIKFEELEEVPGYKNYFTSKNVFACFFRVKALIKIGKSEVIEQWMNSEAVEIEDFFEFYKKIYRELTDKYMIVSILEKYLIGIVYAETTEKG